MARFFYGDSIHNFRDTKPAEILGTLTQASTQFSIEPTQTDAWLYQIEVLKKALLGHEGAIYFEYSIPRMGRRIDNVVIIGSTIFGAEFKVGADEHLQSAVDQVCDYGLDLKNFHDSSHTPVVAPILISTEAATVSRPQKSSIHNDNLLLPIRTNAQGLGAAINQVLELSSGSTVDPKIWERGRYSPTPTIIEAAMALYAGHSVAEISRHDSEATNLTLTSDAISKVIQDARTRSRKAIVFLTGVPGAGKTLVGLNIATLHTKAGLLSVFLSGNEPLVSVLREALARDRVAQEKTRGKKAPKSRFLSEVKAFIQNVHHFRDECLEDKGPPAEHVALFDEAQRAWDLPKTADFMKRKKKRPNFNRSEADFLISCLDRHNDWAVVVCLVGGGQEIHTGEAGISGWIDALNQSYPNWDVYISSRLNDSEYAAGSALKLLEPRKNVFKQDDLHLSVSMRSFRAEHVSLFTKQVLDLELAEARATLSRIPKFRLHLTRDLSKAKQWLRDQARGSERFGLIASSQAERLRPHAIDVRVPIKPVNWFLQGNKDVRSSFFLEDVATEFQVQGLELDWTCVTWDADFRLTASGWQHWEFRGNRWNRLRKPERQSYLKNAYRVLLTRARQGMVIFVPRGDPDDLTRLPEFYDRTFEYFRSIGVPVLG